MKKLSLYLFLLSTLIVILGSCATNKLEYISKDNEIYGTWVNDDYDGNVNTFAKMTFYITGDVDLFNSSSDNKPIGKGYFYITNKWFDSKGGVWYTLRLEKGLYAVVYIDSLGTTLSFAAERSNYPQNVDWTDLDHIPLHRFYTRK